MYSIKKLLLSTYLLSSNFLRYIFDLLLLENRKIEKDGKEIKRKKRNDFDDKNGIKITYPLWDHLIPILYRFDILLTSCFALSERFALPLNLPLRFSLPSETKKKKKKEEKIEKNNIGQSYFIFKYVNTLFSRVIIIEMKLKHLECAAFIYNDNYINFSNYAKAFAKKKNITPNHEFIFICLVLFCI